MRKELVVTSEDSKLNVMLMKSIVGASKLFRRYGQMGVFEEFNSNEEGEAIALIRKGCEREAERRLSRMDSNARMIPNARKVGLRLFIREVKGGGESGEKNNSNASE